MKARLNITIEASLLQRIKAYAAKKHISVSELAENYFDQLTHRETKKESIFDFLKREKIRPAAYPENFDFKTAYHKHLEEKYGK